MQNFFNLTTTKTGNSFKYFQNEKKRENKICVVLIEKNNPLDPRLRNNKHFGKQFEDFSLSSWVVPKPRSLERNLKSRNRFYSRFSWQSFGWRLAASPGGLLNLLEKTLKSSTICPRTPILIDCCTCVLNR